VKTHRYIAAGVALPVLLLAALALQHEWPLHDVLADPAETHVYEPLHAIGTLAYVAAWFGAAASAMLAFLVSRQRWFLALAGLSIYMGLDDALMLHEAVFPYHLHIKEQHTLLALALISGGMVIRLRRHVADNRPALLLAVATLFGLSLGADSRTVRGWFGFPTHDDTILVATLVEDGAKMIGTWLWMVWVVLAAVAAIRPMVRRSPTEPGVMVAVAVD